MDAKPGDKVRLKSADHLDERGVIESCDRKRLWVRLVTSGDVVSVEAEEVTNFSLAARKAWESMPERRVGRPKGTAKTDRVSVTLRINRELWDEFRLAEENGLVPDRTTTINDWLAEKLSELLDEGSRVRTRRKGGE